MFTSISWSTYLTAVAIVTAVYYLAIAFVFFRKDMVTVIQKYSAGHTYSQSEHPQEPSYLEMLIEHNMIVCDNIRAYLQRAASEQTGKDACIYELKLILKQFPMLCDTSFMGSINNLILKEADLHKITFLPVEEVDALWVKVG